MAPDNRFDLIHRDVFNGFDLEFFEIIGSYGRRYVKVALAGNDIVSVSLLTAPMLKQEFDALHHHHSSPKMLRMLREVKKKNTT